MTTAEFTKESEHNAWNYLGRVFDLGTLGCSAAMVSQPRVGLCPLGRRRSRSPHRCHSRAPWTYLDIALVGLGAVVVPSGPRRPVSPGDHIGGSQKVSVVCRALLFFFSR